MRYSTSNTVLAFTVASQRPRVRARSSLSVSAVLLALVSAGISGFSGVANAQYYGGLMLNQPRQSTVTATALFGFNGGDAPAELASLDPQVAFASASRAGLQLRDAPSLGMKLGYRFNPYFSIEGRYANRAADSLDRAVFGVMKFGFANPEFSLGITAQREKSFGLDFVGTLPVMKSVSLQGRAGFRSDVVDRSDLFNFPSPHAFTPVTAGVIGIGLQFNFNQRVGLRFEAERSRRYFNDRFAGEADHANNVSLGVLWRF